MFLTLRAPGTLPCYCSCIGIQQNIFFIEQQSLFWIIRSINPISIFELLYLQSENHHGIYITDFVLLWKRQDGIGFFRSLSKQQKLAGGSSVGMNGKIDSAGKRHGSKNIKQSWPYRKSFNFPQGRNRHGII